MTIFEAIISPFIFTIEQLFLLGFELTNNYGAAIILLSLGISLLLLPVFIFIEKAKKKDDAIKQKMQPSVDIIKRVYKGQERYYYLKNLNRQFGYNPLKALIPILSLLLQIPFFIAAYQYLESYEALKGVSFWFINDLSQADGLLGAINILPIAMTVVNLITAWFYTRGGNTSERKQMLIVAAAFLILLFNLPAGLVLYWTMNNVFSFFRLFVTNPEVFKKIERVKKERKSLNLEKRFSLFYRFSFFAFLLLLPAVFIGAEGYNNSMAFICLVFLLVVKIVICVQIYLNAKNSKRLNLRNFISVALLAIYAALLFTWTEADGYLKFAARAFITLLFIVNNHSFFAKNNEQKNINIKGISTVYFLTVAYILLLIFIVHPLIVYSSFPSEFSFTTGTLILENFKILGISIVAFTIIYLLFYTKLLKINLTAFVTALAVLFLFNCFIFPIDVGTLQLGFFEKAEGLNQESWIYFAESFVFGFLYLFFRKNLLTKVKLFRTVAIVLLIVLVAQGLNSTIKVDYDEKQMADNQIEYIPKNQTEYIPFSKTEQNVIVFVADMFLGHYIFDLLESIPELENKLDGFTYYPNTLAVSSITSTSMPAMFAGINYNINELNKDTEHTMSQKFDKTFNLFKDKIKSKGYNLVSNDIIYSSIKPTDFDFYLPRWDKHWEKYYNKSYDESRDLYLDILWQNALFYSVPNMFKKHIYENGNWLVQQRKKGQNFMFSYLAFVNSLPKISKVVDDSKGSFMFYHCEVTHFPWHVLDKDANVCKATAMENQKWFIEQFINWINWMKEAGVYDNTKIVLISDHSYVMALEQVKKYGSKHKWNGGDKLDAVRFWQLSSLMLVKDFKSRGELKTDWRLMSNADMSDIALNDSSIMRKPIDTMRVVPAFVTDFVPQLEFENNIKTLNKFNVQGNMYNPDNWLPFEDN